MRIYIPDQQFLPPIISFCKDIELVDADSHYMFDFSQVKYFSPFGMLILSQKIREFRAKRGESSFEYCNYEQHTYAANMGFFQSIDVEFGKMPGEALGNNYYLPVSQIKGEELFKKARIQKEHFVDTISNDAYKLAKVLSNSDETVCEVLKLALTEIIRNVFEHSSSQNLWFAGQYLPSKDRIEIAISDNGIGIENSLRKNKKLKISQNIEALQMAISPGVTSNAEIYDINDPYSNRGYGLYTVSSLCALKGDFVLCSGDNALAKNSHSQSIFDTKNLGTIIRMRLIASQIPYLSLAKPGIISKGEKIAKKNKNIQRASFLR